MELIAFSYLPHVKGDLDGELPVIHSKYESPVSLPHI